MSENRSEKPTQKRQKQFRDEGRVLTANLLLAGIQTTVAIHALESSGPELWRTGRTLVAGALVSLRPEQVVALTAQQSEALMSIAYAPLLGSAAAWAAHIGVTGGSFSMAGLGKGLSQLNPTSRLTSVFTNGFRQMLMAMAFTPILLGLSAMAVWSSSDYLVSGSLLPIQTASSQAAEHTIGLAKKLAWLTLLVGIVDFVRQKRQFDEQLMMTKQEVKQEFQDEEGRPEVNAQIRRMRRDLLRRKMMSDVATASVVVTNPTHYAIALRYEIGQVGAPTVIAKGKNYLAQRIRERALEANVPIVENPPIARALYKATNVGSEIPPALYRAVAEILALVNRIAQRKR